MTEYTTKEKIIDDIYTIWNIKNKLQKPIPRINVLIKPKKNFDESDIVAILTKWREFESYDYSKALLFS